MAKIARKQKVPYVISPRGMLEPWSLQQSKLKKQLALKLYQYKDLKKATCLHATSSMEAQNLRSLDLMNPIAVIPNGIPMEEFPIKNFEEPGPVNKILFLSRIHPKKGIELLIEAWSHLPAKITKGWHIDIVGNGADAYIAHLKILIYEKGLDNNIFIKGPMYGLGKVKAYQEASLFVLPTYSENFGIVVAEALACGTPVITTQGAPWQDLESYKCGWWIQIGVKPLKQAMVRALTLPSETLEAKGKNGRQLIEQKYSMHAVAEQMQQLYDWILNNKKRPDFVRLD
jgi:glycosyltransferase involved in cell wall biosynthesis